MRRQRLEPTDLADVAPKQTLAVKTLAERSQSSGRQGLAMDAGGRFQHGAIACPTECPSQFDVGEVRTDFTVQPPTASSAERRKKAACEQDAEHRGRSGGGNCWSFRTRTWRAPPARYSMPAANTWSRRSVRTINGATAPTLRSAKWSSARSAQPSLTSQPAASTWTSGERARAMAAPAQAIRSAPARMATKPDFVRQVVGVGIFEVGDGDDLAIVGAILEHRQKGLFQRLGCADSGNDDGKPWHGNLSELGSHGRQSKADYRKVAEGEQCRQAIIVRLSSGEQTGNRRSPSIATLAAARRIVSAGIVGQVYYNSLNQLKCAIRRMVAARWSVAAWEC